MKPLALVLLLALMGGCSSRHQKHIEPGVIECKVRPVVVAHREIADSFMCTWGGVFDCTAPRCAVYIAERHELVRVRAGATFPMLPGARYFLGGVQ